MNAPENTNPEWKDAAAEATWWPAAARPIRVNTRTAWLGACGLAMALGCYRGAGYGAHDDGAHDGGAHDDGAESGMNSTLGDDTETGGTGTNETEGGGAAAECEGAPVRVGLRRLSRAEYNRSVRDALGVEINPADNFPSDPVIGGFDNNAEGLRMTPQFVALLLDASEAAAADAVANHRDQIITCDPQADTTCLRSSLAAVAQRLFRRPATEARVNGVVELVERAQESGESFEKALEHGVTAMLMAPEFLFRGVPAAGTTPQAGAVSLDGYALAERLAYFLWSSTPDDALLARAANDDLLDPEVLQAEVDRMLADPRSDVLFDAFVTPWLQLRKLDAARPDSYRFGFNEEMRQSMWEEVRLMFEDLRARDGSMLELITGRQTFVNQALARIYGVAGITGASFVPVDLDPTQRAGVLTTAAVLTMTSDPTTRNIIKRGVWLAQAILCVDPPPPPADIPPLPEVLPGETERDRLARHRADPACSGCHDLIDPLGFGFENYGAIGHWLDEADGEAIDNEGALPDGRSFAGIPNLSELLEQGQEFPECATRKLLTYGLGREPNTPAEVQAVTAIADEGVAPESGFSELMQTIATNPLFTTECTLEGEL